MNENNNNHRYCLVKYFHYEATGKQLECNRCVMDCENKKKNDTGGDSNDQPTN